MALISCLPDGFPGEIPAATCESMEQLLYKHPAVKCLAAWYIETHILKLDEQEMPHYKDLPEPAKLLINPYCLRLVFNAETTIEGTSMRHFWYGVDDGMLRQAEQLNFSMAFAHKDDLNELLDDHLLVTYVDGMLMELHVAGKTFYHVHQWHPTNTDDMPTKLIIPDEIAYNENFKLNTLHQ